MEENKHQEQLEVPEIAKKHSLIQLKSNCFLVSSAIHVKHGVYSSEERFAQTIGTCKSIREKTFADICLLDGGYKDLEESERKELQKYCNLIINFSDHESIKYVHTINNHDIVKNLNELYMFGVFYRANKEKLFDSYTRVFKMSGRYVLNDDFDLFYHMDQHGKIVIRGPYTTQFNAQITGGVVLQYMSRLWSFPTSLSEQISEIYIKMIQHMTQRVNNGGYIDIEHLLYNYLDRKIIVNPPKIGIQGNIAPNGVGIME